MNFIILIIFGLSCGIFMPGAAFGGWTSYKFVNASDSSAGVSSAWTRDGDPVIYDKNSLPALYCPTVTYSLNGGPSTTFTATGSQCLSTSTWPSGSYYQLASPVSYSQGVWLFTIRRSICSLTVQDTPVYYGADGLSCYTTVLDHGMCSYVETELPTASACCSNDLKDGMEWGLDMGGACEGLDAYCPEGQIAFESGSGLKFCGKTVAGLDEAACMASVPSEREYAFYHPTSGCLEVAGLSSYAKPEPSNDPPVDTLEGLDILAQIGVDNLKQSVTNTLSIVSAINKNSDLTNSGDKSIISAIVDSKSAIVAAINAKDFSPVINVAAPSVSVSSPSVTVDTSSTNTAILDAKIQAQTDAAITKASIDALTAAILGQGPGGAAADLSGVESRLDALNAKHVSPVVDPLGLVVSPLLAPGLSDRFRDRFDLFTGRIESAPVFSALGSVMSFPSGGGAPSTSVSMGSYGTFQMDFSPMAAALGVFGKLAIAASFLVSVRLILANK